MSTNTNFQLSFSICEGHSCDSFIIKDTTPIYSLQETQGWGTPNPLPSDVVLAELVVVLTDGTSVSLNLTTLSSGVFPNSDGITWEINASSLGLDSFVDGVYQFTLTYSGVTIAGNEIAWSSTSSKYILFSCNTQCCLDKLFLKVESDDCNCKNSPLATIMKASGFLTAARFAAGCGRPKQAKKLLDAASFLCSKTNCQNC